MSKLIGLFRIGNDPELRYTNTQMAVLQLSLAYNYGKEKKTQWVNATLFGKRAESLSNFLAKGQLIYGEVSDIHIDTYAAKDGTERVSLKGVVQEVGLTAKADAPQQAQQVQQRSQRPSAESPADMDDDIPF